jgi:hypothetical protein
MAKFTFDPTWLVEAPGIKSRFHAASVGRLYHCIAEEKRGFGSY